MRTDLVLGIPAATQFENRPLQFPTRLLFEQGGREFPIGRFGQRLGHLAACPLALLVFELAAEVVLHGITEVGFRLETAKLLEEFLIEFGQVEPLNLLDLEDGVDRLPAKGDIGASSERGTFVSTTSPGLAPFMSSSKFSITPSWKLSLGADADRLFLGTGDDLFAILERQSRDDVIAGLGRLIAGGELPVIRQNAFDRTIDLFVGEFMRRLFDLQPFPVRQFELGANLQVELEDERAVFGKNDRIEVEIGFADGGSARSLHSPGSARRGPNCF